MFYCNCRIVSTPLAIHKGSFLRKIEVLQSALGCLTAESEKYSEILANDAYLMGVRRFGTVLWVSTLPWNS